MAKKSKKRKFVKQVYKPMFDACPFCKAKTNPDYKDAASLEKFITDRAKIMSKDRSGVCSKHQRKLAVAVKRARHLALLPFTPSLH